MLSLRQVRRALGVVLLAMLTTWPAIAVRGAGVGAAPQTPPAEEAGAAAGAGTRDAQTRPVVLHRPMHVGDHFRYTATLTTVEQLKVSVDGKESPADQNRSTLELEAQVEVQSVTAHGRPIKCRFQIDRFVRSAPDRADLLQRGVAVIVEGGSGRWSVKPIRGKVSSEIGDLLAKLTDVERFDARPSDDELFGTAEPQAPGAVWPVNSLLIIKDLSRDGMAVAPENLDGSSTFSQLFKLDGVPCMKVATEVKMKNVGMALPSNLQEAKVQKCDMRLVYSGFYPVDPNKLPPATGTITDIAFVATKPAGNDKTTTITYTSYEKLEQGYANVNQD